MKRGVISTAAIAALAIGSACSSGSGQSSTGGGGGSSTGAASGSGGSLQSGGRSGGGGVASTSGGAGGGTLATGGSAAGSGGTTAGSGGTTTVVGSGGASGGAVGSGGTGAAGGTVGSGGTSGRGGASGAGGVALTGGTPGSGGAGTGGVNATGGAATRTGGTSGGTGGTTGTGAATGTGGTTSSCSGPIGNFSGPLSTGIIFMDDQGQRVNAHGGGIIREGNTYYMHGEYFLSSSTANDFQGFSMYSSQDMATWKNEGIILPQQPACPTLPPTGTCGVLGPVTKGERPHIIKCPATGEFVLYAHAASEDYQTWKEVVYATSNTVSGQYTLKGALTNASGAIASHSDMSAITDGNNAYVITESGHVYTLSTDCHSWLSDKSFSAINGDSTGSESPTVFKAGSTYYWIGSYKTGWRANNNFYATAPAMTGPWTHQGFLAPVTDTSTTTPSGQPNPPEWISDQRTWLSQSTWVMPVSGCNGTVYVYWGDHWDGTTSTSPTPGLHNYLTGYVFQPIVFTGTAISLPTYHDPWKLDVGAGTWSP